MRLLRRLLALCAAVLVALAGNGGHAAAATDPDQFLAGIVWHRTFDSPSLLRVGSTYWAYGTTIGGDNLPVLHSTDLATWWTRSAYPAGANPGWWSGYNDALPHPAAWAYYGIHRNGRAFTAPWAPSVAQLGSRFVAAYSVPMNGSGRRCISIATAAAPQGPFLDSSSAPITCSADPRGSIDPQVLTPGDGNAYLLWKNAGVPGSAPTRIWVRRLGASGTAFAAGSTAHLLLTTSRPWEGTVVENPAMIHYGRGYYLFYSGNDYTTTRYATGYARCSGPLGPCWRAQAGPLLATGGPIAGPGGASPVVGPYGGLRLAYHAWDAGHTAMSDPRRLHVAYLSVDAAGHLHVGSPG